MPYFLRTIPAALVAGALGVCLMGAVNDPVTPADTAFAPAAMNAMLQSIADAEAVQGGSASGDVNKLAASIQSDELSLGTQLSQLANYYGINVSTDLPKSHANAGSFASDQVTQLKNVIAIMNAERTGGNASQLRTFADDAIPVLQKDLQAAQALAK